MSTTSYYLYQKYISVDGGEPTPAYPAEYSYDGEGTMPPVVKEQYDTECGQVDTYRWVDTDDFICEESYSSQYLTIESLENGNTIYWKYDTGYSARTISASTDDGNTWTAYTSTSGGSGTTIATLNNGNKLLIKGQNNRYMYNRFASTKQFKAYGNIMSLVSGDTFENADTLTNIATFSRLFKGATGLVDAENLVLPATSLSSDCYEAMFYNCTSLTTAPSVLPATTLANDCYWAMFYNCTSLTTAPQLPATTLAENCYWHMFRDCTSLTIAPELPATTLANYCYYYMFLNCTGLTTAPSVLPATTLAEHCYEDMFRDCTSLTIAPELPATTLADSCYEAMFQGCTNLIAAPALPATTLSYRCYAWMFRNCTNLVNAPALPATTLTDYCYAWMFIGCANLTTAPSLPATTLTDSCYIQMFDGCTSLTTAPVLPATTLASHCYYDMFFGCTNLNYIKCLATDISASNCTFQWLASVASTGTFVKASGMNDWTRGFSGIPNNWTVQNA